MSKKNFALIGPGRTGTALAYLLTEQGYNLRAVIGRSRETLERAQLYFKKSTIFSSSLTELPADLHFIIIGARDDEIAGIVKDLANRGLFVSPMTLIHLSGVHLADIGQLPEMTNIHRLSMHPLQAVADIEAGIAKLSESVWSIEGDITALILGEELLNSLKVRWLKLQKEQKVLYHAAACVTSNYLVTLVQTGIEMLQRAGFPPDLAQEALMPLITGTLENLREKTPIEALTGPIARGDATTIAKHLDAIASTNPSWFPLYQTLGLKTLDYAKLSTETAKNLQKLLKEEIK